MARSGRVAALLHDSWLRGAVPAGTDDVPPSAAPSRHVAVPGVAVLLDGGARLRVASTGSDDAVVRYRLDRPAGEVQPPGPGVLTVPAGGVAEVSLRWLRPGAYAAVLDADAPVTAAASLTVAGPAARAAPDGGLRPRLDRRRAAAHRGRRRRGAATGGLRHAVVTAAPASTRLAADRRRPGHAGSLRESDAQGHPLRALTVAVPAGCTVGVTLTAATAGYLLASRPGRRCTRRWS